MAEAKISLSIDGVQAVNSGFKVVSERLSDATARIKDQTAAITSLADAHAKVVESNRQIAMSAAQTAAAMRMVPAQFTDIITSLQGGQKPLTVLLQQGGQLKDMFGGIGPAAQALGGYVLGLVNPLTLAAAAGLGLAYAAYSGREEFEALNNTMKLTGGYTGQTTKQITDMAARLGASGGNISEATEALRLLIATGKVSGDQLEGFGRVVLQMAKATGGGVKEAVSSLAGLSDDAVKWAEKYNEQYHFMTAAQYSLAKQYQDSGDKAAATKVVIESLQEAHTRMYSKAYEELGDLEKAAQFWASAYDKVKQYALSIGKPDSNFEKINKALADRELLEKQLAFNQEARNEQEARRISKLLEWNRDYINGLRQKGQAEREEAAKNKAAAEEAARAIGLGNYLDDIKYADKKTKYSLEVKKENEAFATAVKGFSETSKEYEQALIRHKANLAQIAEQNKEKPGPVNNDIANLNAKLKAEQEYLAQLKLSGGAAEKLNEGEKDAIKYGEQLKGKIDAKTRARLEESVAISKQRAETLTAIEAEKEQIKATEEAEKSHVKFIATLSAGLDKFKADVEVQRMHNAQIGLSKEAIAELEAVKLEDQATTLEGIAIKQMDKNLDSEQYDLLKAQAQALRDLAAAKRMGAAKQASYDAAEEHRKAWEKANDQISQSLTSAIMRGGKSAGEYLKDYFRTLILRPVVQAIANPIAGAINGVFGNSPYGSLGSGFTQGAGLINAGSTLWSAATGGMTSTIGGGVAGLGNVLGSSTLTEFGAGMQGATLAPGLMGPTTAGASGAAGIGSSIGTAMPYLAAAIAIYSIAKSLDHSGTYHTGALAEYNAATGLLTGSNGSHAGPRAGDTNYGTGFGGVDFSQQTADFVSGVSKSIVGILDSTASTFGKTAGYTAATAFADDTSKDGAWGALLISKMGQSVVNWNDTRNSSWAPREFGDGEAGRTQYLAELSKSVRTALDDIGLPGWAQSMLDNLGNAPALTDLAAVVDKINAVQHAVVSMGDAIAGFSNLSDGAVSALITASGGVDAFSASMSAFYDGYYTEGEKIANTSRQVSDALSAVGLQMPATREEFRGLVEQELALGEAGAPAVAALLRVSGAFGQVADYAGQLADQSIADAQRLVDATNKRGDLEIQIMELSGDKAGALAAQRAKELAALDASLRPLQERIWALQDEKAAVDDARGVLSEAYNRESSALQQTIDKFKAFSQSLRDFRDSLLTGNLSTLSPEAKYQEIKSKFDRTYSLALSGDPTAMGDLQSVAQQFLEASRGYYASSEGYANDFGRVQAALESSANAADVQANIGQQQLSMLERSIAGILDVNQSVISVREALERYFNVGGTVDAAAAAASGTVPAGAVMGGAAGQAFADVAAYGAQYGGDAYYFIPGVNDYVAKQQVVQMNMDALAGSEYSHSQDETWQLVTGHSQSYWEEVQRQWDAGLHPTTTSIPGFDIGGDHFGGLRIVGESGPELEATGPSRIFNASQTRDILSGASSKEVADLLRQILTRLDAANSQRGAVGTETLDRLEQVAEKLDATRRRIAEIGQ